MAVKPSDLAKTESSLLAQAPVRVDETALVIIDMQRFYTDPVLENASGLNWKNEYSREETAALAARMDDVVQQFRDNGVQIVTVTTFLNEARFEHKKAKALGGEDYHGYTPEDGDLHATKDGTPAFLKGDLGAVLEKRGIKSLFMAGVYAEPDMCLGRTAQEGVDHGYAVTVLSDLTATAQERNTVADSLRQLEEKGVGQTTSAEALEQVRAGRDTSQVRIKPLSSPKP